MQAAHELDFDQPQDADTGAGDPLSGGLETLATSTWALPAVFAFAYALAWFFSVKNLLLVTGHVVAMVAAGVLIEGANRMRTKPEARGPALAAEVSGVVAAGLLLYALYPMTRMFLAIEEPVFAALESADPQARLAMTMIAAFAALAAGFVSFVLGLAKLGRALGESTRGLNQVLFAALLGAALASLLHAAYGYMESMRDLRHLFAFGLVAAALWVIAGLRPVLLRVATALRHRSADAA